MNPYYADDWLTVYGGDARDVLPALAADSVDCIVTSPPYWGLRDYGTASWSGGDAECDHAKDRTVGISSSTLDGGKATTNHQREAAYRHTCGKCGAVRQDSQLGLERTPEEYVANMVGIFRELRRVLKPSGTCWLNLGDTYSAGAMTGKQGPNSWVTHTGSDHNKLPARKPPEGLKPKDLVGIPWRVAFALQADGWYLRSDIIWAKPNPMPESVTDRPTKSHEYLFLLTKSARYYFDGDAVREPAERAGDIPGGGGSHRWEGANGHNKDGLADLGTRPVADGRNLRSVWTIATRPYPGAHFAVFPPELPERCIKAGSSERGVCPECGAPWERVVERGESSWESRKAAGDPMRYGTDGAAKRRSLEDADDRKAGGLGRPAPRSLAGWQPSCHCDASEWLGDASPAVVLDPFAGSGTTGMVANRLSRRAILIDLNPEYLKQQMKRNAQTPLGLGAA